MKIFLIYPWVLWLDDRSISPSAWLDTRLLSLMRFWSPLFPWAQSVFVKSYHCLGSFRRQTNVILMRHSCPILGLTFCRVFLLMQRSEATWDVTRSKQERERIGTQHPESDFMFSIDDSVLPLVSQWASSSHDWKPDQQGNICTASIPQFPLYYIEVPIAFTLLLTEEIWSTTNKRHQDPRGPNSKHFICDKMALTREVSEMSWQIHDPEVKWWKANRIII